MKSTLIQNLFPDMLAYIVVNTDGWLGGPEIGRLTSMLFWKGLVFGSHSTRQYLPCSRSIYEAAKPSERPFFNQ